MSEAIIRLENVNKWFGQFHVLRNINLNVAPSERIVICGPSGSGKSTMIRCINRLEEHQQGHIVVDGLELTNDLKHIEAVRRDVGMVFQHFNLFPHLTVLENLTLGPVWVLKKSKAEAEATAMKYLERVRIPEQALKYPGQLSGGQQQRVAIARAVANAPLVLLAGLGSVLAEALVGRRTSAVVLRSGLLLVAVAVPVVALAPAFQEELQRFFYRGHWCYVGLECEIPEPGNFKRTVVGERSVIMVRDHDGEVRVWNLEDGKEVVAFIVARESVASEELDRLCLDNIARYTRPKGYRFVESLPKNNYGKVLKTELRNWVRKEIGPIAKPRDIRFAQAHIFLSPQPSNASTKWSIHARTAGNMPRRCG